MEFLFDTGGCNDVDFKVRRHDEDVINKCSKKTDDKCNQIRLHQPQQQQDHPLRSIHFQQLDSTVIKAIFLKPAFSFFVRHLDLNVLLREICETSNER